MILDLSVELLHEIGGQPNQRNLHEICNPSVSMKPLVFSTHNVDAVAQLHNVTSLEMSVNSADVLNIQASMTSVDLLVRTAALLPALRTLTILYTSRQGDHF
ncbi:hypothetical protein C8R44DRAFT_890302 [Mycena epipterygia]|nr:hypothetical protein C8R44DRAFT_890302 [Mycena epipterygia]